MLPKACRLRRSRDFREAFARGRSYSLDSLRLVVRRTGTDGIRVGFVVSKKLGGAVARNRVKRLLREACRDIVGMWRPGADAVFVARASLRDKRLEEVRAAVTALALRAGLVADRPGASDGMEAGGRKCAGSASA
jgi:ribonuclease P protein component